MEFSVGSDQGELARFSRTGSFLHLAHAARALEEASRELDIIRQKALARKLDGSFDAQ